MQWNNDFTIRELSSKKVTEKERNGKNPVLETEHIPWSLTPGCFTTKFMSLWYWETCSKKKKNLPILVRHLHREPDSLTYYYHWKVWPQYLKSYHFSWVRKVPPSHHRKMRIRLKTKPNTKTHWLHRLWRKERGQYYCLQLMSPEKDCTLLSKENINYCFKTQVF